MRLERKIRAADQSIIYLKAELIKLNSKIELFKFKQRVQDNNFKHQYLEKNIFQGLNNLNDGFDVPDVRYFNKEDFEKVLDRVKEKGIGIYGIECWRDGEYYDIDTYENHQTYPQNPNWYFKAFERFKQMDKNLLYSASYYVPSNF